MRNNYSLVPTWQAEDIQPSRSGPRMVSPTGGVGGLVLDFLSATANDAAINSLAAARRRRTAKMAVAGKAAGVLAGQTGAPLPQETQNDWVTALLGPDQGSEEYNRQATLGYVAGLQNRVRIGLTEAQTAAGEDEGAFLSGIEQIRSSLGQVPEEFVPAVDLELQQGVANYRQALAETQRARAVELQTAETRTALDDLRVQAVRAARSGDGESAASARAQYWSMGEAGVKAGTLTGEYVGDQRKQLDAEMREQHVSGLFWDVLDQGGAPAARQFLVQFTTRAGETGLDPDRTDRLIGQMTRELDSRAAEAERSEARAARAADRRDRLEEKALRRQQQDTFKEAIDQQIAGKLDYQWLQEHRDSLDDGQYARLKGDIDDQLSGAGSKDMSTYVTLDRRARSGDDPTRSADEALVAGKISREERDAIVKRYYDQQGDIYDAGRQRIERELKSRFDEYTGEFRTGIQDFETWEVRRRSGGSVTYEEVEKQAELVIGRVAAARMRSLRKPYYLVTTDTGPDVQATIRSIQDAFDAGDLSADERTKELELLKALVDAQGAPQ